MIFGYFGRTSSGFRFAFTRIICILYIFLFLLCYDCGAGPFEYSTTHNTMPTTDFGLSVCVLLTLSVQCAWLRYAINSVNIPFVLRPHIDNNKIRLFVWQSFCGRDDVVVCVQICNGRHTGTAAMTRTKT